MSILFKELPVNISNISTDILICENVEVSVYKISEVNKQFIIFDCQLKYKINNIEQTKFQRYICPHSMIEGNVYQQCYEYLKKTLNVNGYSNI